MALFSCPPLPSAPSSLLPTVCQTALRLSHLTGFATSHRMIYALITSAFKCWAKKSSLCKTNCGGGVGKPAHQHAQHTKAASQQRCQADRSCHSLSPHAIQWEGLCFAKEGKYFADLIPLSASSCRPPQGHMDNADLRSGCCTRHAGKEPQLQQAVPCAMGLHPTVLGVLGLALRTGTIKHPWDIGLMASDLGSSDVAVAVGTRGVSVF